MRIFLKFVGFNSVFPIRARLLVLRANSGVTPPPQHLNYVANISINPYPITRKICSEVPVYVFLSQVFPNKQTRHANPIDYDIPQPTNIPLCNDYMPGLRKAKSWSSRPSAVVTEST